MFIVFAAYLRFSFVGLEVDFIGSIFQFVEKILISLFLLEVYNSSFFTVILVLNAIKSSVYIAFHVILLPKHHIFA